eukprot:1075862-Amphidinium_carterae.1
MLVRPLPVLARRACAKHPLQLAVRCLAAGASDHAHHLKLGHATSSSSNSAPQMASSASEERSPAIQQTADVPSSSLLEQPSGVGAIQYKGPILEDAGGAARHEPTLSAMFGNIPNHVRASFDA